MKLGLMKPFANVLLKDGDYLKHLCRKFYNLSDAKLKEEIVVGPKIHKLMFISNLEEMSRKENVSWIIFKEVVTKFMANVKSNNYGLMVANMIRHISFKVDFLLNHVDLVDVSEEKGQRFHQEIKEIE